MSEQPEGNPPSSERQSPPQAQGEAPFPVEEAAPWASPGAPDPAGQQVPQVGGGAQWPAGQPLPRPGFEAPRVGPGAAANPPAMTVSQQGFPPMAPGAGTPAFQGVPGYHGSAPAAPPAWLPVVPESYARMWRAPGLRWWRPIVALALGTVLVIAVATVILMLFLAVDPGISLAEGIVTPGAFLANNLILAALIGVGALVSLWPMRQRPGWLFSVVGRIRWGWMIRVAVALLPVWLVMNAIDFSVSGVFSTLSLQPHTGAMVVVILTTQVFQCAGEEVAFRGVINRGVASLIPDRWLGQLIAAAVSSWLFMLSHGAGDTWLNVYYITFGMAAAYLTWRTGGLEAAIALHCVNNLLALWPIAFSEMDGVFAREAGVGSPWLLFNCAVLVGACFLITWLAKRHGIQQYSSPQFPSPVMAGPA